ncbi:Rrf2 family transcriptional regulator [Xanthomonas hortorum pv. pelargonii]|nr:Rrf2 family transcriptional regulator [Xanthomonas hortorum pv. pelargonii]
MPTSTRFVVAVHILTALAVSDGKPLRSEDLAYSANTGPVVVRSLLSRLAEAGLTRSQLGAGGGALLARQAKTIRLLDVYQAVEDTELFPRIERHPARIAQSAETSSKRLARRWRGHARRLKRSWQKPVLRRSQQRWRGLESFRSRWCGEVFPINVIE